MTVVLKDCDKYIITPYNEDDEPTVMVNGEDLPYLARYEIDMATAVEITAEDLHDHAVITDDGMVAVLSEEDYNHFKSTSMRA